METLVLAALAVFPILMIVAGLHDLTTMRIPNWISLALLAAFFPVALLVGLSPLDIAAHVGVGVAALFVGMALFAMNWLGGGDAKLLAAACLWMGLGGALPFVLYSALLGGLLCLALITARRTIPAFPGWPAWTTRLLEPKGDVPYGVALAAGALFTFSTSPMLAAFAAG